MSGSPTQGSWTSRVFAAVVMLLVIAGAARATWELLRPLLGALVVVAMLVAILGFLVRRHRRW